jgi:UDP-N-acetylglucosamine:LPS N-acetylglucosamine transferase
MKNILFASYGGGHVNMLSPLYELALKDKNIKAHYFALTTAQNTLKEKKLPFFSYSDLIGSNKLAIKLGKQLLCEMGDSKIIPTQESIAYLGLSYLDLIQTHGESKALALYKDMGRHAFLQKATAKQVLEELKPDLLISTNSPKTEEALIRTASEKGIPTIIIIDLFSQKEINERLGEDNYGSKLCVSTPYMKDLLILSGRKPTEIVITGNPAFDQLIENTKLFNTKNLRAKRDWQDKKIILWAKQSHPNSTEINKEIEVKLFELVSTDENFALIFRPHPNDTETYSEYSHKSVYISKEPSSELPAILKTSNIALSINSTTIFEAALLGIPSFTIEYSNFTENLSFAKAGITTGIYSIDNLISTLKGPSNIRALKNLPQLGTAKKLIFDIISSSSRRL